MFVVHIVPLLTGLRRTRDRLLIRLRHPTGARDSGQGTVEYALMLLGAAVIAIAFLTWATGTGRIGDLFDSVFDEIQSRM